MIKKLLQEFWDWAVWVHEVTPSIWERMCESKKRKLLLEFIAQKSWELAKKQVFLREADITQEFFDWLCSCCDITPLFWSSLEREVKSQYMIEYLVQKYREMDKAIGLR